MRISLLTLVLLGGGIGLYSQAPTPQFTVSELENTANAVNPTPGALEILRFTVSAPAVAIGGSVSAKLELNASATNLTVIALTASIGAISLPAAVVIDRGFTSVEFTISAGPIPSPVPVVITASMPDPAPSTRTVTLTVLSRLPGDDASGILRFRSGDREIAANLEARRAARPAPPPFTVGPSILGPSDGETRYLLGRLTLSAPAPPSGAQFRLASDTTGVEPPSQIQIPPGQTSVSFPISVAPNVSRTITITAYPSSLVASTPLVATVRFARSPFATDTIRPGAGEYQGSLLIDGSDIPIHVTRTWSGDGTVQVAIQSLVQGTETAFSLASAPVALPDLDSNTLDFSRLRTLGFLQRAEAPEFFASGIARLSLDAKTGELSGTMELCTESRTLLASLTARPDVQPASFRLTVTQEVIALPVAEGQLTYGRVELAAPAPAEGLTVAIQSSAPELSVPPEVRVPPNATTLDFPITLRGTPSDSTITATVGEAIATRRVRFSQSPFALPESQRQQSHEGTLAFDDRTMSFDMIRRWTREGEVSVEIVGGNGTTESALEISLLPEPLLDLSADSLVLRRFTALGYVQSGGPPEFIVSGTLDLKLLDAGRTMRGEMRLRTSTRSYSITLQQVTTPLEDGAPTALPFLTLEPSVIPAVSRESRQLSGYVRLSNPAPPAGAAITLLSDNSGVIVPDTVRVSPGNSTQFFNYTVRPGVNQSTVITAIGDGRSESAILRFSNSLFTTLSPSDTYVGTLTFPDGRVMPLTLEPRWLDDGSISLGLRAGDDSVLSSFAFDYILATLPNLDSNTLTFTEFPPLTHLQWNGPPIFIESAELSITLR